MKNINYFIIVALMSINCSLYAEDLSKEAMIKELLVLTQVDKTKDKMQEQLIKRMRKVYAKLGDFKDNDAIFKKHREKVAKEFSESMKWKELEPKYIEIYSAAFSEKEIKAIIAFYKTTEGQSMLKKMPEITLKSVDLYKKDLVALQAKIQVATLDMLKSLEAKKEKERKEAKVKKKEQENNKEKEEK